MKTKENLAIVNIELKDNKDNKIIEKRNNKATPLKQKKGVTLLILVVTIVILLIITAVSISEFTDEDTGIIEKSQGVVDDWEESKARENVELKELHKELQDEMTKLDKK